MLPSTGHTHELSDVAKLRLPSSEKLFVVSFIHYELHVVSVHSFISDCSHSRTFGLCGAQQGVTGHDHVQDGLGQVGVEMSDGG